MIIEFTGIPGSGKTTLCAVLQQFLISRGYHVWTQADYWYQMGNKQSPFSRRMLFIFRKLIVCLKIALKNLHLISLVSWRHILAGQSFQNKWLCLNSLMSNLAEHEAAKNLASHNTIALIDEGVFHRAYSLFVTPEKYLDINKIFLYGRVAKLPDLLIYLKAPVPVCFDRIRRRGLPIRMRRLKDNVALKMMFKGEKALNTLIKDLKQRKLDTVSVIEFECQDISETNRKLLNYIENLLSSTKINDVYFLKKI